MSRQSLFLHFYFFVVFSPRMAYRFHRMIALDIETGSLPDPALTIPEFDPPAGWKDPEKIAAFLERKRVAFREQAALYAFSGKVVAVGFYDSDEGFYWESELNLPEPELLAWTWGELLNPVAVATFNGVDFDFPMLIRRSWICGVPVPSWVLENDGYMSRLISMNDTRRLWCMRDRQAPGNLGQLFAAFGLPPKFGDGADFYDLLKNGKKEEAAAYLERDVTGTWQLRQRMTP